MHWIHSFDLFLFDFDGLLVNTEPLHYQAYMNALNRRGCPLDWGFSRFCELAHLDGQALRSALCAECPTLAADWSSFYKEKREAYFELLGTQEAELMPGVTELLEALQTANKQRCVVTNSPHDQIVVTRSRTPILQTLPHWITREDYTAAKPAPDGYLRAIELHGKLGDRIIGFEDSIRGLKSLTQTPALPILICPDHHPLLNIALGQAHHFRSFIEIPADFHI